MPRYLVERSDAERLRFPTRTGEGWDEIIEINAEYGVTWIHSYVAADRGASFCLCDAPHPEAIRVASRLTGLPIERITEVRVLSPYLHA